MAFGQPVVGEPDLPERPRSTAGGVCDDSVSMGAQAYCDLSCAIDPSDGASTCGERVAVDGRTAVLDVAGLHEIELVVNACAREGSGWSLADERGASVIAEAASIEVRGASGESLHRDAEHLPEGECAERSVVLQDARLELVRADRRVCDAGLLRMPGRGDGARWRLGWTGGVRSIELCLRNAR